MTSSLAPDPAASSTQLARWLVDQLVDRGMTDVVLCPGSRNAPLSFALAADERVTLHTRIDERTAGFLALGLAKGSHRPAAVVTTSGTAGANLHPAVLEAAHAGVRLVAITADRPARLRGTGANQTTDQVRLYGDAAGFLDLSSPGAEALDAAWVPDGPIHLNCQFDDPLLTSVDTDGARPLSPPPRTWRSTNVSDDARSGTEAHRLGPGRRTVVIAGDDAGPAARRLAEVGGWPLLAEPSSGSRTGTSPIRTYRLLLGTQLGARIERAVVFGHPTLSRPVAQLLSRADVQVISSRARGRWPDRPYPVAAEYDSIEAAVQQVTETDSAWLQEWHDADRALAADIDSFVAAEPGLTPYEVAAAVDAANPPGGLLFVGASNPVRDLDLMAGAHPVGERRMVLANRGLAGIDGTVSSAIGAALGRPGSTRAILYVGDVTFLHDANALVLGPWEARPDLTIVVANDNGGSIFATLEQGSEEFAPSYELLFGTPHGVDLGSLCAATRTPHWRVTEQAELEHALSSPAGGIEVVEAVIRRDNRRALDEAIRSLRDRSAAGHRSSQKG